MSRDDALKFLRDDCVFDEPLTESDGENLWLEYRHKVEALPEQDSRPAEILPMSEADVKAARRFRSRYPGEHSIIDIVRLDPRELVVHQHWISPSLAERYSLNATLSKWNVTSLLNPPTAVPPKSRREGDTIVFDLPHSEFLLMDRPGTQSLLELREPNPFVTVAFHAGRAVLLTGYHRTFALARHLMAIPNPPAGVLFAVSNALDLLGSDAADVKTAMESARPPRVADFFDPRVFFAVEIRKRRYQMRIRCEISQLDAGEVTPEPAAAKRAVHPHNNNRERETAIENYAGILRIQPNNKTVHMNLAAVLLESGRISEAKAHAERAVWLDPGSAEAHCSLGAVHRAQRAIDAAKRDYRQALAIDPGHIGALICLGQLHSVAGEFDDALSSFRKALARQPECAYAWLALSAIKKFSPADPELKALERFVSRQAVDGRDAVFSNFALAKALEDCGDYDRAFEQFRIGNEHQKRAMTSDEQQSIRLSGAVTRLFSQGAIERLSGSGNPSRVPIFVVGMPRSGTTLIEQVLASHRQVYGAGELEILHDLLRTGVDLCDPSAVEAVDGTMIRQMADAYLERLPSRLGKERVVDKMPSNFLFAGLIHLMFPNAKIIHAMRDPLDTCVSCYSKLFDRGQSFSYDLAELGRYYTRYEALMNHWRSVLPAGCILDVRYENLVSEFEPEVRRLLDFCELDWDEGCRNFYRTSRPVSTSSMAQVRQPLYDTSIGRWRRFEKHLGPLVAELKAGGGSHSAGA